MDEKKCPKCSNRMDCVTTEETSNRSVIQIVVFKEKFGVERFLCFSCGFSEEWISAATLAKAKKVFKK